MINVTRSSMPDFDEYCDEISQLWDSHWLTNAGCIHQKLQNELQSFLGVKYVSLFTNGHLALEAIWEAYDFPKGSEVITTPFTFCSTTHAIARKGLVPVFCDIDPVSYCIDPSKIESLITDKTVAICPVHVYGNICDVDSISRIAKRYGLKVVYDAAHAFGAKYRNTSSACFGDMTMFSFHATKVFNTIEGGCVCLSDTKLYEKLEDLKNFGIHKSESFPYVGGNAKMNEFQAAMGVCNLRHLLSHIEKRKNIFERYMKNLGNIPGLILPSVQSEVSKNYAYFPVVFDGYKKTRDVVFEELKTKGIIARKYFYPLTNEMECYRVLRDHNNNETPVAQRVANKVLTLPLYSDLSLDDVDFICNVIIM